MQLRDDAFLGKVTLRDRNVLKREVPPYWTNSKCFRHGGICLGHRSLIEAYYAGYAGEMMLLDLRHLEKDKISIRDFAYENEQATANVIASLCAGSIEHAREDDAFREECLQELNLLYGSMGGSILPKVQIAVHQGLELFKKK